MLLQIHPKRILSLIIFLIFCATPFLQLQAITVGGDETNPFKFTVEDYFQVEPGQKVIVPLTIEIPKGHYLYADQTSVEFEKIPASVKLDEIKKPQSTTKEDPFFGKTVEVYYDEVEIDLNFQLPEQAWDGALEVEGVAKYQGCSKAICFRMIKVPLKFVFEVKKKS